MGANYLRPSLHRGGGFAVRDAVPSRPIVQEGAGPESLGGSSSVSGALTTALPSVESAIRVSHPARSFWKRTLDLAASLLLLMLLGPALICVALAVRLDSPGPAIFRQVRTGLGGRPFQVFKFRSMVVCAADDTSPASVNDPRITRLGALLRRSSIDELPQLLNVLCGEMSLVGPRPHAVEHDRKFAEEIEGYDLRFRVRPGVTGLAQINGSRGGGDVFEMRRRLSLDNRYIATWSIWSDVRILVMTIPHLLFFRAH
jgi:putative colanic acid biosynthesis UDP-glucose lipid carrier transferase